ncbi:MAG: WD repeat-containing protein 78, partial [Paramarteilia canceri]
EFSFQKNVHLENLHKSFQIAEKASSQMRYKELNIDYAFWDDSDCLNLLPLWSFSTAKKGQTTHVSWLSSETSTPRFVVSWFEPIYSDEENLNYITTFIKSYSIKNPRFAEKSYSIKNFKLTTLKSCEILNFTNFVCTGFKNGSVSVISFDSELRENSKDEINQFKLIESHTKCIKEVNWINKTSENHSGDIVISFISLSSCGTIIKWNVDPKKVELEPNLHLNLIKYNSYSTFGDETFKKMFGPFGSYETINASTICFEIQGNYGRKEEEGSSKQKIIVGTDTGLIMLGNLVYTPTIYKMFRAHEGRINGLRYHPFINDVFVTFSGWQMKIWYCDEE